MNSRRKEFMGDYEINVDLWPAGVWTPDELDRFKNLVKEAGSTSGQISSGIRGIEPQIVLAFVGLAVAAGFLEKLGSELFEHFRNELKRLLLKRRNNTEEIGGRLSFSYEDDGIGLYAFYTCVYSNGAELDTLFSSLYSLNSSVVAARNKSLLPFDDGQKYELHAILEFERSPKWNLRIRRYSTKGDELILNEFFNTTIDPGELKESTWERLNWDSMTGLNFQPPAQ